MISSLFLKILYFLWLFLFFLFLAYLNYICFFCVFFYNILSSIYCILIIYKVRSKYSLFHKNQYIFFPFFLYLSIFFFAVYQFENLLALVKLQIFLEIFILLREPHVYNHSTILITELKIPSTARLCLPIPTPLSIKGKCAVRIHTALLI